VNHNINELKEPEIYNTNVRMTQDGRMNAENAATYIDVSPKTLAQWRSLEKGPPFKKKGGIWYFKDEVDVWLRSS